MTRRDLLLEIGLEEMPARFMPPALKQLEELAAEGLAEARLEYGGIRTLGAPRRLALLVTDLAAVQKDVVVQVRGPSLKAAYDEQGRPTKALLGFARSQGIDVADVVQQEVKGVPYVFADKVEAGRPAQEVLPRLLRDWLARLSFPKSMRWGWEETRFARPIRWLVALYGREVLPLEFAGVRAGNTSRGHRFLAPEPLPIDEPGRYEEALARAWVIADPRRRRELIWNEARELAAARGGSIQEDPDLLEEITFLVEYPTVLWGAIAEKHMHLPPEVLVTTMKEHQRYFPVQAGEDRLLPGFIAVANGIQGDAAAVRRGNERVLGARLEDAAFFWSEDRKQPLVTRLEKLERVVFLEKLGSVGDRVRRLTRLAGWLSGHLGLDSAVKAGAQRAAVLSKADLVTYMVNEYPELQGIMGEKYALLAGEDPAVARAIREQYLPRFAGDALPQSPQGRVLALADKMDAIVGCFILGLIPTGSQDPYALRRHAQGICLIAMDGELPLSLSALGREAYAAYREQFALDASQEQVEQAMADFFAQRLRYLLGEAGVSYDVIDAVLAAGFDRPAQVLMRARALTEFRRHADFEALLTAYTRAANLAGKGEGGPVCPELFSDPAEGALWQAVQKAAADRAAAGSDFGAVLQIMADLRPAVDAFFDAVLVMAEDAEVRRNRLALLAAVTALMDGVADLSKIVTG